MATAVATTSAGVNRSTRPDACASVSARFAEPLAGTAGATRFWLLVEHPGPWPADALMQALGPDLLAEIERRAPGVRTVLIRKSARHQVARPLCVLVSSAGPAPWMRQIRLDDYRQILDLDLEALAAGAQPKTGQERTEALFTVCTHGKRDACCAAFGRPVLRAVAAEYDEVWECTHIGGDRFAGNLVCFPHGLYYGHLDVASALSAAQSYEAGKVQLDNLRGRSGLPPAAQVAEHCVRAHTGFDGIGEVVAGEPRDVDTGSAHVQVSANGQMYDVALDGRSVNPSITGGCDLREPVNRVAWSLRSLRSTDQQYSYSPQEVR